MQTTPLPDSVVYSNQVKSAPSPVEDVWTLRKCKAVSPTANTWFGALAGAAIASELAGFHPSWSDIQTRIVCRITVPICKGLTLS